MEEYSQKVKDHYTNPRNTGVIENPSGEGTVGNPVCGDIMTIYIDVDEDETLKEVKFSTFGCGAAIATSSMITEMATGMNIDDAYKITRNDVAEELDGLPPIKLHCSNLAADALQAAIEDYKRKKEDK
ncbi:Fe-S cluster assembly scaffold protein NifU [Methanosphaera sp. BMS]|uniref:Fe-S cluster assembly scaffold protein NifU n=1 Tax=Methanosphaera sp. BMS TaxID=1789762 RepID=UPI000DC1DF88|nr:Fe-S cluster assembly scaffold protein NifU [Methanosphaera sp. BMS]AWX33570.1 iron-sulfur cluster assembly scaffold protein [Methanosphaera sp. BMS]